MMDDENIEPDVVFAMSGTNKRSITKNKNDSAKGRNGKKKKNMPPNKDCRQSEYSIFY